jgi:hypothetical protein
VTQMWWPTPESLKDLTVEETEEGFDLSAPEGSECGLWLAYFSETEELRQEFQAEFETCLLNYIQEQDGKNEVPDRSESGCSG